MVALACGSGINLLLPELVRRGLAALEAKAQGGWPARYRLTTDGYAAREYLTTPDADAIIDAALAADME